METIEQVGKQHDSFEEVDRVLTIVEESKKDYEKLYDEYISRRRVTSYYLFLLSVISVFFAFRDLFLRKETLLGQLFFIIPLIIFTYVEFKNTFFYNKIINKKEKDYKATNSQATEVLREIIPVISRRDNWSAIKKTEIRLRLSKLDISPEEILDEKRL